MARLRLFLFFTLVCLVAFGCGGSGGGSATTGTTGIGGQGKWTVLVYMNAANNLYRDSDLNVIQMQKAAGNPLVRIVAQWKQTQALYPQSSFDGTRRYLVKPSVANTVVSQKLQDLGAGIDMGDPQTLSDFITWGKASFPADHYLLILWDHGNGWRMKMKQAPLGRAFSYDDQSQHAIQIWNLQTALGTQQFDTIVWDCSLMQMAEVDYQIRANTRWSVSSEESPPEQGYPYDVALAKYRDLPDDTALDLAKSWVDSMLADPLYTTRNIEESVVDTTQLTAVSNAVDGLAGQLIANNQALSTLTQNTRANGQSYDETVSPPRYFFDLTDIATRYKGGTANATVDQACTTAINAVAAAVAYEKHNTHSPGSHGLSIDFTPGATFNANGLGQYLLLDFGKANRWAQWLTIAP